MFTPYLSRWNLVRDGEPIATPGARLLPVRYRREAAMLKIGVDAEEKYGGLMMSWWGGKGAARVFETHGNAILIERALGNRSLAGWARNGRDDDATRVLCDVLASLHAPRIKPYPDKLVPLQQWFRALELIAPAHGGLFLRAQSSADRLLAEPRDVVPLHGDMHHDNVLDFGEKRGWLAIDPKRVFGERSFDYANIFFNPDLSDPTPPVAIKQEYFLRRLDLVTSVANIDRQRMLNWILAFAGLSAAWFIEDGGDWSIELRVAEMAVAELDR